MKTAPDRGETDLVGKTVYLPVKVLFDDGKYLLLENMTFIRRSKAVIKNS